MSNPVRILLVDDHALFRESLVRFLESESDFRVVGHCATIVQARQILSSAPVDVILLDYDLGEEFGTDLLQELHIRESSVRVLIVTAGMRDSVTVNALNTGVSGVIFKHSGPGQLIDAIQRVAKGETWLDEGIMRSLIADSSERKESEQGVRSLSERQHQVLRSILDGLANKEIAAKLEVSETSVKATIQELFNKAGVRTRSQLVRIAIEKYSTDWLRSER
ncbi:response regulator transcription factor [Acidobacterium sp. S8]|uniref:response regulator n=1 Tax=Acidobacterium sp. S8 TaxID=1641854 RepID=UPI00131E6DDF|nr:response regulator transcription factor [Acidobacterium sp. S8]